MKHKIEITNRALLSTRWTTFFAGTPAEISIAHNREAWQCPICSQWEEYETITASRPDKEDEEHCIRGSAGHTRMYDGHSIAYCMSASCTAKVDKMMCVKPRRKP